MFANPADLLGWLGEQRSEAKFRPDQTVVFMRDWGDGGGRLKGVAEAVARLAALASEGKRAAA